MLCQTNPSVACLYPDKSLSILGGVLYLDLFELPPLAKKSGAWQICEKMATIKTVPYPFEQSQAAAAEEEQVTMTQWPATIQFQLPANMNIIKENARIVWWNQEAHQWSSDGIDDVDIIPSILSIDCLKKS
jgi:hypothetical protein